MKHLHYSRTQILPWWFGQDGPLENLGSLKKLGGDPVIEGSFILFFSSKVESHWCLMQSPDFGRHIWLRTSRSLSVQLSNITQLFLKMKSDCFQAN